VRISSLVLGGAEDACPLALAIASAADSANIVAATGSRRLLFVISGLP
jgi:hypothetical protein